MHTCTHKQTHTYAYRHSTQKQFQKTRSFGRHAWLKLYYNLYSNEWHNQPQLKCIHCVYVENTHVLESTFVTGPTKITMWVQITLSYIFANIYNSESTSVVKFCNSLLINFSILYSAAIQSMLCIKYKITEANVSIIYTNTVIKICMHTWIHRTACLSL